MLCYNHMYRGEFCTTAKDLQTNSSFVFQNEGNPVGKLTVLSATKDVEYSIVDYLRGGTQISLVVGIDFTGSNGDPKDPNSLHYFNPRQNDSLNPYQQAILAIGSILLNYDDDKLVDSE